MKFSEITRLIKNNIFSITLSWAFYSLALAALYYYLSNSAITENNRALTIGVIGICMAVIIVQDFIEKDIDIKDVSGLSISSTLGALTAFSITAVIPFLMPLFGTDTLIIIALIQAFLLLFFTITLLISFKTKKKKHPYFYILSISTFYWIILVLSVPK